MSVINEECLVFWKRKLQEIGRYGIILLLTKDDEELIELEAKYIPYTIWKERQAALCVVSDTEEIIEKFQNRINISIHYEIVNREYFDEMERTENAFGIFERIYSDVSTPMEDGDFYNLIGYDNVTLEDIVCSVMFRLDHIPSEEEVKEAERWITNHQEYHNCFGSIHSITGKYEQENNEDLMRRQKKIVEGKVSLSNKNIYLYADTQFALLCIDGYKEYNIVGIIDRDESKSGIMRKGVPIYNLSKISELDFDNDIVFITNYKFEETVVKLNSMGGVINKDYFVLNPCPDINDRSEEDFISLISEEIEKGKKVYEGLRKTFPREKFLLSPWNASGDIYVAGLYLSDYIEKNCPNGYCVFVTSAAAKKVSEMLGYKTELISQEDMDSMLLYIRYKGFEETNSLNTNVNYPNKFSTQRIAELFRILDFNTAHQRMAFQAEEKKTRLAINQKNSDDIFEQYNLVKGKTILIVPYSNTLGSIPEKHGKELVERLKEKGYSVCTNVAGDEKAIEGTEGIFIPYDTVLDFVNKAGGAIGVRSGLFDIVSSSESRMVVYYKKSHQSLFSLIHMGLKVDNIIEMNDDDYTWDEIVERTIDFYD